MKGSSSKALRTSKITSNLKEWEALCKKWDWSKKGGFDLYVRLKSRSVVGEKPKKTKTLREFVV